MSAKVFQGFLLIFATIGLVGSLVVEDVPHSRPRSFAETINQKVAMNEELISELQLCIDECEPQDSDLAKRFKGLIQPVVDGSKSFQDVLPEIIQVVAAALQTYDLKNDADNLIATYQSAYGLTFAVESARVDVPGFVDRVENGIKSLPNRFPEMAKAHGLYASLKATKGAPAQVIIESYKKCVELDPSFEFCRDAYERSVQEYEKERCLSENIKSSFGIYSGSDQKRSGFTKQVSSRDGSKSYFVSSKPGLAANDLKNITPSVNEYNQKTLNLDFTAEGAKALEKVTEKNINKLMVVVVDSKALIAPVITQKLSGGKAQISVSGTEPKTETELLGLVCEQTTKRSLPDELRL